jgi:hypothetical protein
VHLVAPRREPFARDRQASVMLPMAGVGRLDRAGILGPTATALSTEEVRHATEVRVARAAEELIASPAW